jgi:hypothetical protein
MPQQLTLTFNTATTPFLGPPQVSAVINDPTDPAALTGIVVDVKDAGAPIAAASYTLTAASSNPSVISNGNIGITQANGQATIKVLPTGVGYANITLTLTRAGSTKTLVINYAASAAAATPAATRFHTGISNASAAIALDDNYMVVADDEQNRLYVHHRTSSGLPVASFSYNNGLSLTDSSDGILKEVDVEASTRSKSIANRVYWLGSMSNSNNFNNKPNRNRIFATTISGTGASTVITLAGYYSTLRATLIAWGNTHGYNLTASAAVGKDPKLIDGFNIEGMCFAPDNTTLYICFRAPMVPVNNRTKALIAPIQNFESWFNNGAPAGNPVIGAPIELTLDGRSIRDIIPVSAGGYLVIAGSHGAADVAAVFTWSGVATEQPVLQSGFNVNGLNLEAVLEVNSGGQPAHNKYQFLSDDGSKVYYGDARPSKDLVANYQKFRSDIIALPIVLPVVIDFFSARLNNLHVALSWRVPQSHNVLTFEVYRSYTGSSFQKIATLSGIAQTTVYSFADELNLVQQHAYYRIKAKFRNNTVVQSAIQSVTTDARDIIKVTPNPVPGNNFSITTTHAGQKQVKMMSASGAVVREQTFANGQVQLSAIGLAHGIYQLIVSSSTGMFAATQLVVGT